MSKTFLYVLAVIGVYVLIVYPNRAKKTEEKTEEKTETNKADTENGTGLNENANEDGVSQGAAGQMKYRIGYTS